MDPKLTLSNIAQHLDRYGYFDAFGPKQSLDVTRTAGSVNPKEEGKS